MYRSVSWSIRLVHWAVFSRQTAAGLTGSALTLIPFTVSSAFYLIYWLPFHSRPSISTITAKCLPIVCLWAFVYKQGIHRSYNKLVLAGLVASCLGDALLVYTRDYFTEGLLAFAVAISIYSLAFGLRPFGAKIGAVTGALGVLCYLLLYPGLSGVMTWLCLIYTGLMTLMCWRALVRALHFLVNRKHIPWALSLIAGGFLFLISDMVLAINKFRFPIPSGDHIIMITYYAAQLSISLSVIRSSRKKSVN